MKILSCVIFTFLFAMTCINVNAKNSPLQINIEEKYSGVDYGDIPLTHINLDIISKSDKITIKKIIVNRGNSKMKCESKDMPEAFNNMFDGMPGYGSLRATLKFGDSWHCSGPKENILEVIIDTEEFGPLKYTF